MMDDCKSKKWRARSATSQILAASAENIILFGIGLLTGLPTIVIPRVHNVPANETLSLTDEEVSWLGSIHFIMNPTSCLVSGLLSNSLGRKRSMQILNLPLISAWIIFYFANSAPMLWTGAAVTGLTGGLLEASVVIYIGEAVEPHLRGILSTMSIAALTCGIFTEYLLGSLIHWKTACLISAVIPITSFFVFFFIPESPHWLLGKRRYEDTQKALCWLRGWTTTERIQDEYNKLVKEIHPDTKTRHNENELTLERKNRFSSFSVDNYIRRTFVIPFLLILYTSVILQFTGVTTLCMYGVNMFNSFGAPISGYYATVMVGLSRFFGPLTSSALIRYTGKRPLLLVSTMLLGIVTGSAGLYGYLYLGLEKMDNGAHVNEQFHGMQKFSWFPMVCLICVPFLSYLGVGVTFWLLIGEVFSAEVRGVASGISSGFSFFFAFISSKTIFKFINILTLPGVFMLYAAVAFSSLPVFYFILPETEGWSLAEVQEHFAGKRNLIKAGRKKRGKTTSGAEHDDPLPIMDERTKL